MTTTETGRNAESIVAEHFRQKGYKIIEQNWRTRWCEIDVIVQNANCIYFIEVKHRKNSNYGAGLDAINTKKLEQMSFAAELWVANKKWKGDYQLLAVSTGGTPPIITEIVDL
jgi:uncharacterized protein (TIGR00252 family)